MRDLAVCPEEAEIVREIFWMIAEEGYDNVIIPTDRKCHYKAAIGERNKYKQAKKFKALKKVLFFKNNY